MKQENHIRLQLTDNLSFELRNIEVCEFLSEETTAFHADIFINGVECGYCRNSGNGEGNFPRVDCKYYDLLNEIERELSNHTFTYNHNGETHSWKYDIDFLIGDMVYMNYNYGKTTYKFQ